MKRFQFLMGFLCGALMLGGFTSVASAASGIVAALSNQAVYVDGRQVSLTAYQIDGNKKITSSCGTWAKRWASTFIGMASRYK